MRDTLPPVADPAALVRTRRAWHAVGEHVLAAARYRADGRIGLAVTPGGFGTPAYGDGRSARVAGLDLVVSDADGERATPLTTLAVAAAAVGVEPGAPPVYVAETPLSLDALLEIDPQAAELLARWFDLTWTVLRALGEPVTLWPEHFDVACELGDEARGERGTFGASPGDDQHGEPYLYVTHWADVPDDEYWNDTSFRGASLAYADVARADDAAVAAREFFGRGRRLLTRD
jgi:hypothetical protein